MSKEPEFYCGPGNGSWRALTRMPIVKPCSELFYFISQHPLLKRPENNRGGIEAVWPKWDEVGDYWFVTWLPEKTGRAAARLTVYANGRLELLFYGRDGKPQACWSTQASAAEPLERRIEECFQYVADNWLDVLARHLKEQA